VSYADSIFSKFGETLTKLDKSFSGPAITVNSSVGKLYLSREFVRIALEESKTSSINNSHLQKFLEQVFNKKINRNEFSELYQFIGLGTGKITTQVGKGETIEAESLQCVICALLRSNKDKSLAEITDYICNLTDIPNYKQLENSIDIPLKLAQIQSYFSFNDLNKATHQNAESWIFSGYQVAVKLNTFLKTGNEYLFCHQNSKMGKLVKTDTIAKLVSTFKLKNLSSKPDIYNPADIFIISKNKESELNAVFKEKFTGSEESQILANYKNNVHTYKSVCFRYLQAKDLIMVSLKKATSISPGLTLVGTAQVNAFPHFKDTVDNYTIFLKKMYEQRHDPTVMQRMIESLVNIIDIDYKDTTVTYNVLFDLKWNNENVNVSYDVELLSMGTYQNTFNIKKRVGATAFYGGIGFDGLSEILQSYSQFRKFTEELMEIRSSVFKELSPEPPPSSLIKLGFVYKKKDLEQTEKLLGPELFQEFLVRCILRFTELARKSPPNREALKYDSLEKYTKTQAMWLFTKPEFKGWLNSYFKKQIALTIYGVSAKKGGKIFEPDPSRLEDPIKKEYVPISAFKELVIPPHIVVGQ